MNPAGKIVLAGGSGFLGTRLLEPLLARGYELAILTRQVPRNSEARGITYHTWDGKTPGTWASVIDGATAVFNLTGRNVNCRYNSANAREIMESRVESVRVIGEAIRSAAQPPKLWVQAGSLAIYGNTGERWCDEFTPAGEDGLPVDTCLAWEKMFSETLTKETRKVLLRIGFVLDKGRGALATLERLVRCFLGGRVASGRQYISWIHWVDMNNIFLRALEEVHWEGAFNATSPDPVSNAEFMRELRQALRRPWSPPVPRPMVYLGAWAMRTEGSLALTGRRCAPRRLLEEGFRFQFTDLKGALRDIYPR